MTAPEFMTDHPTDEIMAAFIDGRLDREAHGQVIAHLAECGDCRSIVVLADECRTEAAVPVSVRSHRRWMPIAGALAAAAIAIFVFATLLRRDRMDQMVAASESLKYRPATARLSAEFPYRRAKPVLRSGPRETELDPTNAELWSALAKVQQAADDAPSPSELHVLGVGYLLADKPENAVTALEKALASEHGESDLFKAISRSSNPELLNDFAATYQTLIERRQALQYQPLAVEAVQRAWSLKKTPQIAWTRAVVIEGLHLRENAIRAWGDYLALDPGSEWRDEALGRLQELQQPTASDLWPATRDRLSRQVLSLGELQAIVQRFPQQVRVWCEEELLPQWGTAVLADELSAHGQLLRLAALGDALEAVNRERDVRDAVRAIRRADANQVRQLARGHVAYGSGRRAIVDSSAAAAIKQMDVAVAELTPALTPFAWRARAEHAAAVYTDERYAEALDELAVLEQQIDKPTRVLVGRIHWIQGIASLRSKSPDKAVEYYLQALAAFREAGETNAQAGLHTRLSAAYRDLGDEKEARDHDSAALQLLAESGDVRRRHEVIFEAAYTAIRKDQPALADLFLDTVVEYDVASKNPVTACTSLMWRGTYLLRRGRMEPASRDLQDARSFCKSIADRTARERALANLGLAQAMVAESAADNVPALDASIAYYQRTNSRDWLRTAYVVRAGLLQSRGDVQAAERDFQAALSEMAVARGQITEQSNRLAFTATADEVADRYIEFLLKQGRERTAFEVADRSRARELVDSPSARWQVEAIEATTMATIQSSLPNNAAILEYRVLGGRVVAWVVGRHTVEMRSLTVSYTEIQRLLARVDPAKTEAEFKASMAPLYDALLAPLESLYKPFSTLVIIPDDLLERVPYPALYDGDAEKYVVETRTTLTAYSTELFAQSIARYAQRTASTEVMVVVESASAGRETDALPDADREAQFVAAQFPSAHVIPAAEATVANVFQVAGAATMLHFAGHGGAAGSRSAGALRLGDDSNLTAADFVNATMPRLRLAYLSACDTDSGPILKAEGSATIARAFFAAGVPLVVATLWPVEDSIARSVARVFYERLRAGAPPADALRTAQLYVLSHGTGSRADWAAFRIIGAGIPFEQRSS